MIEDSLKEEFSEDFKGKEQLGTKGGYDFVVTKKHIWAFYGYAISFLPYALALGNIIPPMLELIAVNNGYELDGITPCTPKPKYRCIVPFGSTMVPTATFALYISAIAVVIQALFLILFSALADHGYWRNRFIIIFTILGGVTSAIYVAIPVNQLIVITVLIVIANVSNAISSAFYYSYLPLLTTYHPEVLSVKDKSEYYNTRDHISNKLSANSFSLGMIGAFIVTIIASGISLAYGSSPFTLQLGATLNGAWWLVLGLVSYCFLPRHPSPPLPSGSNAATFTMLQLWNSLIHVKDSFDIWIALLSWFFISDGLSTAMYVAIFVSRSELTVSPTNTLFLAAFAPLAECIGMIMLYYIKRKLHTIISTKRMVILLTFCCILITIWGILGHYTPFGLKSNGEYYAYYILLVTFYATLQSFHRVMYAELVPHGRESECFGIYLISYKGTSWIGSLTVGAIVAKTGMVRLGFWFVLGLFVLGLICLFLINIQRAQKKAIKLAK